MTTAPGRRRFSDEDLLDAALRVFHDCGYHDAQMPEIAAAAGTSKQTLYDRFGGKENVFLAVLEREGSMLGGFLANAYRSSRGKSLREQTEATTLSLFHYGRTRTAGFVLLLGKRGGPSNEVLSGLLDRVTADLATLLISVERGSRDGASAQDHLRAAACVGAGRQVLEYALDHDLDLEDAGRLATDFIEAAFRDLRRS